MLASVMSVRVYSYTRARVEGLFFMLDTAQAYRNEAEAGQAIHDSGLKREDIFITTKYSGLDGLDIKTSIQNSLKNVRLHRNHRFFRVDVELVIFQLGVSYVDLYLIHHPRLATPDIPTAWKQMEELKKEGLVKSGPLAFDDYH
jgi:diketogulonate reductase-like aldo/keto reductase